MAGCSGPLTAACRGRRFQASDSLASIASPSAQAGRSGSEATIRCGRPRIQVRRLPSTTLALGLYRSTNNGAAWTRIDNGWPQAVANGIAVDPNNPNVILAATPDGVHKTTNGGQTWTISSGGTSGYSLNNLRFAPGNSSRVAM